MLRHVTTPTTPEQPIAEPAAARHGLDPGVHPGFRTLGRGPAAVPGMGERPEAG